MKPTYGGCMVIWPGLNLSKWNAPRISGCTTSYGVGRFSAFVQFSRNARRLRLTPASSLSFQPSQAEQSRSDPGWFTERPGQLAEEERGQERFPAYARDFPPPQSARPASRDTTARSQSTPTP